MNGAALWGLIAYALEHALIEPCEQTWAINALLEMLQLEKCPPPTAPMDTQGELAPLLDALLDDAAARGALTDNSVTGRDLMDTALMGRLTPRPAEVIACFGALYTQSPQAATDWYYRFSQDTNYIRRDRIKKDIKWITPTQYGALEITINLAKPEQDPCAIAAGKTAPSDRYPRCLLCSENEGYAGRLGHPARQNHRIIPITIADAPWFMQYSPYVYYNEHCICFNAEHTPMRIDHACFDKLLDFIGQFPHYFVGSNADLPLVGGSILAHDHFQGGRHTFPMEQAPVERAVSFPDFPDITAGIVRWPLSVLRLTGADPTRVSALGARILDAWRAYSDPEAFIFAETEGEPHNTITPIARRNGADFELDLVLRNNIATQEHPLGVYHPHAALHHIKKENIGLIEVMGLAILPARLKEELSAVAEALISGGDLRKDARTEKHADWAEGFRAQCEAEPSRAMEIVHHETGLVFLEALEHSGVFKRTPQGQAAFLRFIDHVS